MIELIVKELTIPPRIYMDMALLRRLSNGHPKRGEVSKDLARRRAGYRGEQNLYYHLSFLPQDDSQIFYDLGVSVNNRSCQIDTFLLYPSFCLILETKNLSGTLHVDPVFNQFIRSIDDKEEGFPNPILQVQRQKTLLNGWLCQHEMPVIPIEYLVVISNPSTLLKLVCETDPVPQTMLHAEQIVSKIR
ncbi:nuclease-related domain-containing protein [Terrilactibacillus sp. S3-3]|nr:nuclease-related domain-containing protein [Terrilactibacillus sp. S3-3]